MNNDTPQVSGEDTRGYPQDWNSFGGQDDEDFPAFRGWAGWGDRVEPVAPDDDYPPPSLSGYELPSYESQAFEPRSYELEYSREPGYPPQPGPGQAGYPAGPGYAPDAGYGYPGELGFVEDPGYGAEQGYRGDPDPGPEATSVPPMEQLPDPEEFFDTPVLAARPAPAPAPAPPPVVSAPVAVGPQETTQSWDAVQDWDEGRAWDEDGSWRQDEPVPEPPAPEFPVPQAPAPELPGPEASAPEAGYARETSDSLTSESLLHGRRAAPGSGWRRGVYRATGGLLRFGESAAEMRRRDLINRVRTPVAGGHHRVAVLSLKGGVGKTTTAVGLGATLATLRGDRVIAVDANPDRGTLSDKVRLETPATIRDLLNERGQVSRYADVRAFTSQAPSRLEVLASDRDPAVSVAFGAEDYSDVARVLEHFYSVCITDCGTGLLHSAMAGVLSLADQIILVSSPSVDGARSASATLDWLEAHGYGDLVRNGVVVLSAIRPKTKSTVDLDRLEHHFAARCRAVARIPYDPHLEEGAEIELELLGSDTAEAYLTLAAVVGDGLAWPRRRGG
jgi:MinD-like ATPase involved in chromosome partitioning or flagellar assembly